MQFRKNPKKNAQNGSDCRWDSIDSVLVTCVCVVYGLLKYYSKHISQNRHLNHNLNAVMVQIKYVFVFTLKMRLSQKTAKIQLIHTISFLKIIIHGVCVRHRYYLLFCKRMIFTLSSLIYIELKVFQQHTLTHRQNERKKDASKPKKIIHFMFVPNAIALMV